MIKVTLQICNSSSTLDVFWHNPTTFRSVIIGLRNNPINFSYNNDVWAGRNHGLVMLLLAGNAAHKFGPTQLYLWLPTFIARGSSHVRPPFSASRGNLFLTKAIP